MAGGAHLGLTSQTIVATSYRSDRISVGNPARPYTSDCQTVKKPNANYIGDNMKKK